MACTLQVAWDDQLTAYDFGARRLEVSGLPLNCRPTAPGTPRRGVTGHRSRGADKLSIAGRRW